MPQDLPNGLRRLWEPDPTPGPQSRPGLSAARIVEAAAELADAGGLAAVSMSRVAQRLGYTTMSLYRHVSGKDELLLLMHDAAWRVPAGPDEPGDGWRAGLLCWCREMRTVMRRHPWLEGIRVTERMGTPSQLTWLDRGLRVLAGTPLGEYDKIQVLLLLNGYVFWDARVVAEFGRAVRARGDSVHDMVIAYGALVRGVTDPVRFPALRRAVDAGAFDAGEIRRYEDFDADFGFGLDRILDGIAHMIAQRSAST